MFKKEKRVLSEKRYLIQTASKNQIITSYRYLDSYINLVKLTNKYWSISPILYQ